MASNVAAILILALIITVIALMARSTIISNTVMEFAKRGAMDRAEERARTNFTIDSITASCADLTVVVTNTGITSVSDFAHMDLIVTYAITGATVNKWLTYTEASLAADQWKKASIAPDNLEPNIWNRTETMTLDALLGTAPMSGVTGTVSVGTPNGVATTSYFNYPISPSSTGFKDPTTEAADTGGDNDGFELNPTDAFSDDSAFASNIDGAGDRHRYYNYGFSIKSSCAITGIEVRLDWWVDATGGGSSLDVDLSWDGGASWTAAKTDSVESTTERTVILGSSSDDWGRTWAPSEFNNSTFRVRVTTNGAGGRDFFLDWVPVRVHFAPP